MEWRCYRSGKVQVEVTEALDEDKGIISSINAPFNSITTTAFPPRHLIIIIVVIK